MQVPRINEHTRIFGAFWVFGLVNNVLYVVILSAAIDLVGPAAPKAIVLLADVLPAFVIKLAAPFFIHVVPYSVRIALLIVLSFVGMQTIAFSNSLGPKLFGIVLASLSSGLGEVSFLSLTHYYGDWALPGFSSGTGAAGLVGSFAFLVMTTWIGLATNTTLIAFSLVPFSFWGVYSVVLPAVDLAMTAKYQQVVEDEEIMPSSSENRAQVVKATKLGSISGTIRRLTPLFTPYMLPLGLVYFAEYAINQGISPTLLFPIEEMPFSRYRDAYVTYGTLYQLGVLISRSSSPFFRVRRLYIPSVLQLLNLALCIFQSLFVVIPNVYILMFLMFYEGLLGGLAYVNTYHLVLEQVPYEEREFAMGAVGVSDSAGIVMSGLVSLWLEKALCGYQQGTGRPWCEMD